MQNKKQKRSSLQAAFFRNLLFYAEKHPIELVLRIELQILYNATAKAFHQKGKWIVQIPSEKALQAYARFTQHCMSNPTRSCTFRSDLYRTAFRLGARIGKITGFTESQDLCRLVFFLYKGIGITMCGTLPGKVHVTKCFFAQCYSPLDCRIMSAMDSGIIAGIFSQNTVGPQLHFSERLTEGCSTCTACFLSK